jgi:hypothetical protein
MNTLLIVLVLCGFGAPWTWLLYRRSADRSLEGLLDRVCFGYAISFALLFVAAQLRLWLFVPLWIAGVLLCIVDAVWRRRPEAQPQQPQPPLSLRPRIGPEGWILLGSSTIYLVLRCLPFIVRRLPIGWDAYFHMTISESILARGRAVHDWMPYENMPLNYPVGSHLLLALTQWLTGTRPHQFFELMVVLFTLLSGLQLFSLTTRATNDRQIGCYAALTYLFLGNYGSLHYAIWSGLPNLIGMYLFLGLLTTLTVDEESRARAIGVFAVYFLAACFVHHHVMVTAGLCLGWTAAVLLALGDKERAKRIITGLVASALIGSPYFLMYVLRTVGLRSTGIAEYMENMADAWSIAQDLGLGFSAAVIAGVYLYFRNRVPVSQIVLQPLAAMLALYVLVEFVFRTGSIVLFQHEMSPFTPSRWITDAVTLLSVFAGIFFRTMQGTRETNRYPIAAIIVAGFFVFNRGTYRDTFNHEVARERRDTYAWIRTHAAPDAVLIDPDLHATYLTRRMSSSFPLPTSEYSALATNRQLLEDIAAGRQPPERADRQVLIVVEPGEPAPPGALLFEHPSGLRVVEAFAPKPMAASDVPPK